MLGRNAEGVVLVLRANTSRRETARKLGAEVHVIEGADPIAEIIRFAREQRITQVFIGHTQQSAWKLWARNPVDRLIQEAEGMDVRIFPHGSGQAA